jgi:hypothetical protein
MHSPSRCSSWAARLSSICVQLENNGQPLGVEIFIGVGRVASRNFLTICLTKILTISAQCGLTPQAAEGRIRWVLAMTIIRVRSQHS